MRRVKKKAVSPLIATVLLIAFAVALGAVVMNWGRGYVQETTEKATESSAADLACTSDVGIGLVAIDGRRQVCYNSTDDQIEFLLENRKNKDVRKLLCRIIGDKSRIPANVAAYNGTSGTDEGELAANQADFFRCVYDDTTVGAPNQLSIIPVLLVGGKEVPCSANSLDIVNIDTCEDLLG